jgi:hypothetical protein
VPGVSNMLQARILESFWEKAGYDKLANLDYSLQTHIFDTEDRMSLQVYDMTEEFASMQNSRNGGWY